MACAMPLRLRKTRALSGQANLLRRGALQALENVLSACFNIICEYLILMLASSELLVDPPAFKGGEKHENH